MNSKKLVFTALFAALISIGCVIAIPLPGGVPITVQNFFCILAGAVLGSFYGAASVLLWLILGAVGIPVFANARGGLAIVLGPTGGYMWGYMLGALFAGLLLGSPKMTDKKNSPKNMLKIAAITLAAYALVYLPGIPYFMHVMAAKGKPVAFQAALKLTFLPFIPGDLLKWIITIPLAAKLRHLAARYLSSEQ